MSIKSFIPATALIFASLVYSCQEEKFTEKGIPEVKTVGVTLLEDGATFHGMVLTDAGMTIKDHGFTWAPAGTIDLSEIQYFYLGPLNDETSFSVTVNSSIEKDEDYVMRAFVVTDAVTSYGNEVGFSGKGSKSSELVSVTPAAASVGDTVVIRGNYFSNNPGSCTVYFGNAEAPIMSSSINELKVAVPYVTVPEVDISVVISGILSANKIKFNVLLPVITEILPASAPSGDTVVIRGQYFAGGLAGCSVFFGTNEARVLAINANEIRTVVPYISQTSAQVRVVTSGIPSVNTVGFSIALPSILGILPQSGTFGDIVNLYGSNLPSDSSYFGVYFNDTKAVVINASRTRLQVQVPAGNTVSPAVISLKYHGNHTYSDRFTLVQAVIDDVSPVLIRHWGPVTISGSFFNPDPAMMRVEIGGLESHIISCNANEIHVSLPAGLIIGLHQVSVTTISGSPVTWDGYIDFQSTWLRMDDFPLNGRVGASGFVIGGKIYYGSGYEQYYIQTHDLWEYNPDSDTWTQKLDFPMPISYATGFSIDNTGFFAMGKQGTSVYRNVTKYDPINDKWQLISMNPGPGSTMDSPGFVINGKVYIPAAGEMNEFNPATNQWTPKSYPSELGYFGGGAAFSINGKGYLGVGWVHEKSGNVAHFFEYDPVTDRWTRRADFPGTLRGNTTFFSLPNGKGYVGMGYSNEEARYLNDVWEYDPSTDNWTQIDIFPGTPRFGARAYVIGSVVFIIGGSSGVYEKDVWRFSPAE